MNLKKYPIDLVYLWVNGADEDFAKEKNFWQKKLNIPVSQDVCDSRYIENDELRYSLRSVFQNIPWVNKIYIVTNGQVPKWLDTRDDRIKIVTHKEIMPNDCLPVFNSRAIESCVANIPGLSEHFLLANDDCFVFKQLKPSFFFTFDGKPIVRLREKKFTKASLKRSLYVRSVFLSIQLIKRKFHKAYSCIPHHNLDAYTKTLYKACKNEYKNEFDELLTHKFRKLSVQRIIFSLYQIVKGKSPLRIIKANKHSNVDSATYAVEPINKMKWKIKLANPALFCINDEPTANDYDRECIKYLLNSFFPEQLPCEKTEPDLPYNFNICLKEKPKNFLKKIFSVSREVYYDAVRKNITIFGICIRHTVGSIKRIKNNYENVLARLREKYKKEPINVIFISQEEQKWGYDSLYKTLKKSRYFSPKVVIYPRKRVLKDKKNGKKIINEHIKFYKSRNIDAVLGCKGKKYTDIKKFNPDIIFYMSRFDLPREIRPIYTSQYALNLFCSYGYEIENVRANYTDDFHIWLFAYFVEHELNKERYTLYNSRAAENCVVTGYPKLDVFVNNSDNIDLARYWKNPDKYKIIYAPHHSILESEVLHISTFLENGKFIQDLAKAHPETTWVYKPHPLLKYKLLKIGWTQQELDEYVAEWKKIGKVYGSGDYFDIFKSSDLMITDCSSFLVEYLPTKKPVIKLCNPRAMENNILGQKVCSEYYLSHSNDELEQIFADLVLNKKDYKKESRERIADEIVDCKQPAADKIFSYIIEVLEQNKTKED
ncbi:MAG: Stealth CR1 domain-containing protein [bacterium]|nr:Stealth CR1 domain-containing protein [bacterium]